MQHSRNSENAAYHLATRADVESPPGIQKQNATLALQSGQDETERKIEETDARVRQETQEAMRSEWRSKSWWQRLKGE